MKTFLVYFVVHAALASGYVADYWTTQHNRSNPLITESSPIGFHKAPEIAMLSVNFVGVEVLSHYVRKDGYPKIALVNQLVWTGMHSVAAIHNVRVGIQADQDLKLLQSLGIDPSTLYPKATKGEARQ